MAGNCRIINQNIEGDECFGKDLTSRTSPESQGLSSQAVLDFLDDAARKGLELHSFMLVRNGCVIAEGWWNPYQLHLRHGLYSLSKSFTPPPSGWQWKKTC